MPHCNKTRDVTVCQWEHRVQEIPENGGYMLKLQTPVTNSKSGSDI